LAISTVQDGTKLLKLPSSETTAGFRFQLAKQGLYTVDEVQELVFSGLPVTEHKFYSDEKWLTPSGLQDL
jgi:hypothetical protein